MKKQLLIISIIIVLVGIFVSCSASSGDAVSDGANPIPTTAVTDSKGTTHYYEIAADSSQTTVLYEIETQADGKTVTEENGKYVTNHHTTVLPQKSINKKSTTKAETEKTSSTANSNDDNNIEFESDETTDINANTTDGANPIPTEKETQPATDKDGWINKWY